MKLNLRVLLVLVPLMMLVFEGCYYFKIAASTQDGRQVVGAINRDKFLIVHNQDGEVWHLQFPQYDNALGQLSGRKSRLGKDHQFYRMVTKLESNSYKKYMGNPGEEVHLYVSEYAIDSINQVLIPVNAIVRMDVYANEKGKSILAQTGKYIGIFIAAYLAFGIVLSLLLF